MKILNDNSSVHQYAITKQCTPFVVGFTLTFLNSQPMFMECYKHYSEDFRRRPFNTYCNSETMVYGFIKGCYLLHIWRVTSKQFSIGTDIFMIVAGSPYHQENACEMLLTCEHWLRFDWQISENKSVATDIGILLYCSAKSEGGICFLVFFLISTPPCRFSYLKVTVINKTKAPEASKRFRNGYAFSYPIHGTLYVIAASSFRWFNKKYNRR